VTGTDPTYVLLPPHRTDSLDNALFNKVCAALATRFDASITTVRPHLKKARISTWGKVRCLDGGDTMHACKMMSMGDDNRDASYIRVSRFSFYVVPILIMCQYEQLVDKNERYRNLPVELQLCTFYGQLQHIVVIHLAKSHCLGIKTSETVFLAVVQTCLEPTVDLNGLDLHYYSKMGRVEVVDMNCVQCVVGRVKDPDSKNGWVVIDRSGSLARAVFSGD